MRPGDGTGGGWRRLLAPLLLLMILALAPALDLAGDAPAAGVPKTPANALDLCTVPGLTPPPPALAPLMAMARVTERAATSGVPLLAPPIDHPPRPA